MYQMDPWGLSANLKAIRQALEPGGFPSKKPFQSGLLLSNHQLPLNNFKA